MKGFQQITFALVLLLAFLLSCSNDPIQKADKAFQEGDYLTAQTYYREALQDHPDNPVLKEKIVLTYFKTGESHYKTRKLIRAFEGQVQKGLMEFPPVVSDSTKKFASGILVELALAFKVEPAVNTGEKQQYLNKSLFYLETALKLDSTNSNILAEMEKLEQEQIQDLMKKGNRYFTAAEKNPKYYFTSEYYFAKALNIKPNYSDARKQLKLVRERGLNLLDMNQLVPIAIKKKYQSGELLAFDVVVMNNSNHVMPLKGDAFFLYTPDSVKYAGIFSEQFAMPYVTKKLKPGEKLTGVITFEAPAKRKYEFLEYNDRNKFIGKKGLP